MKMTNTNINNQDNSASIAISVKVPFFKKKGFKQNAFILSLIAWPVFHFIVFWIYVNFRTIALTLQNYNIYTGTYEWYGFTRFIDFFKKMVLGQDPALFRAMLNSVASVFLNILVILPLAVLSSYAFYKKVPFEKAFRVLFFLPSMISVVVLTMSYKYMFNSDFGPIALFYKKIFGNEQSIAWFSTAANSKTLWPLIWIYCVWAGLGSNVILISGAMLRIPREVTESAKIDGIGFWRELWSIVLPLIMPTLSTYFVIGIMGMFGFMIQPMLLAGSPGEEGKALTVAWHVFSLVNSGSESGAINAATIGLIFSIVGAPVVFLAKWLSDKFTPDVSF